MNYLIVLALLAFSAVNAAPKAQNFDSLSDQQKQQLSMQLEQQIKNAGFDVSKLPHDSNGNLDISQLPKDSNGNIQLSQIVNGGGSGNGGGEIDINGGGGGSVNGGGGGNGGISLRIEQQLKNAGVDVSKLPHDSNGNLDLSQLPKDANGNIEISQIVNGDGGANVNGEGGVNVKRGPGGDGKGDGGVDGGLNEDCGFYEMEDGHGGHELGRYGPGGQYGPHQLKPSETGGKYDAYDAQFKSRDGKIGVTDVGQIVCNEPGLTISEGKIINGTQITLSRLTDKLRDLIIKILNKKAAHGGKKNIFGRAACEADKVIQVFLSGLGDEVRIFGCGLTNVFIKLLKAFKSKNLLGAALVVIEYFIGGSLQFFDEPFNLLAHILKQIVHSVGKIVDLKGKY